MIYTTVEDLEKLDRQKTACFTGHRPSRFSEKIIPSWAIPKLKAKIRSNIIEAVSLGYDTFISGMQRGVDIWAAKEVLFLKQINPSIRLICVAPYATEADDREEADRLEYEEIKAAADGYVALSPAYHIDCYRDRNFFMVDHSSLVISVFNGDHRTGTAQTYRYAQRQGVTVKNIDPRKIADEKNK